jgi:hypothetical protein
MYNITKFKKLAAISGYLERADSSDLKTKNNQTPKTNKTCQNFKISKILTIWLVCDVLRKSGFILQNLSSQS